MRFKQKLLLIFIFFSTVTFAAPPDSVAGRLIFLGVTHDSSRSVWLSVTTAGSFELEAQGHQLIDQWTKSSNGLRISLSPVVSNGNGGTHFLINSVNNRILDSQNQSGGIVFPPFPEEPPGVVMPPIAIPPDQPGTPQHPIVIPPGQPGTPESPIDIPPGAFSPGSSNDQEQPTPSSNRQNAPITQGRFFGQQGNWNIWTDNHYYDISDNRFGLDTRGSAVDVTIGADRRFSTKLLSGLMLSLVDFKTSAFGGDLVNRMKGFNVGPYFGYQISSKWAMDGSLTYGQLQNNNQLAILNSDYTTRLVNGTLRATGLYQCGTFEFLPKPLVSFTRFHNPSYQYTGILEDIPIQIDNPQDNFNFGYAELKLEANDTINTKIGNIVQPYAEIGADYQFARANNGQILTSNFTLATVSPWSGTLTAGIRALFLKKLLMDISGSYLTVGQNGLDVWGLRLLASYSFS